MTTKQKFKYLFLLNLLWSILSVVADWEWLNMVPSYLIPFTSICSLYPPLLTIWYGLKISNRQPPNWLTLWIATGTIAYGLIAQIYFPLLMTWKGLNFHDAGSMLWVAVYGVQTIIVSQYLQRPKIAEISFVLLYLSAADFSHYFFKTFVDFILTGYPDWLKFSAVSVTLLTQAAALFYYSHWKFRSSDYVQQLATAPTVD